jgi:hypothetical protein
MERLKSCRARPRFSKVADRCYERRTAEKSNAKVRQEIEGFIAEVLPPKRKCALCPTLLRSGNPGDRCSLCERKRPMKEER